MIVIPDIPNNIDPYVFQLLMNMKLAIEELQRQQEG